MSSPRRKPGASSKRRQPKNPPAATPPIELYALKVDDIILATMGGTVGGGRFCGMFNSMLSDRFEIESPGEQLLTQLVRHCCERGLTGFDLGIGELQYKGHVLPGCRTSVRQLSAAHRCRHG